MMSLRSSVALALVCAFAAATDVEQCPGRSLEGLSSRVQLNPCKRVPCKLKKGTDQRITIDFTPEEDIANLKNRVTANVLGADVPFIGVDGNSICDKIYTESGDKASCPLKAGTKYTYKDSFPILPFYPNLSTKVKWSLELKKNVDIVCFQVAARIVN